MRGGGRHLLRHPWQRLGAVDQDLERVSGARRSRASRVRERRRVESTLPPYASQASPVAVADGLVDPAAERVPQLDREVVEKSRRPHLTGDGVRRARRSPCRGRVALRIGTGHSDRSYCRGHGPDVHSAAGSKTKGFRAGSRWAGHRHTTNPQLKKGSSHGHHRVRHPRPSRRHHRQGDPPGRRTPAASSSRQSSESPAL